MLEAAFSKNGPNVPLDCPVGDGAGCPGNRSAQVPDVKGVSDGDPEAVLRPRAAPGGSQSQYREKRGEVRRLAHHREAILCRNLVLPSHSNVAGLCLRPGPHLDHGWPPPRSWKIGGFGDWALSLNPDNTLIGCAAAGLTTNISSRNRTARLLLQIDRRGLSTALHRLQLVLLRVGPLSGHARN